MPEIIINDVVIDFPHANPYPVQKTYMEKVIECLRDGKNGVLESPTGTGKTLSLLCSSLAWLQQRKEEAQASQTLDNSGTEELGDVSLSCSINSITVPKIIYASRTHTQLTQAIKELKGTGYNQMKVAVLASRDQLCIHPTLTAETNANKTEMCKSLIKKRPDTLQCDCSFFETYQTLKGDKEFRDTHLNNKIVDIEDLVTAGRQHHFCPYFMSKELIADADIIFMPYNYLLDPKIRNWIGVDLEDAIIILDEAHNVPHVCEDAASIEFKSSHIDEAIQEVGIIEGLLSEFRPETFNASELKELRNILTRFKNAINEIELTSSLTSKEFDGDFIFTIMNEADIGYHTSRNITLLLKNVLEYLSDCIAQRTMSRSKKPKIPHRSPGLRKFNEILWTTFADCGEEYVENIKKHYRVYVLRETWQSSNSQMLQSNEPIKVVNYWCFSPKLALEYLLRRKHVRSIIFTSGTMSPLQPFIASLGIEIQVRLENPHIIDLSQVLVEIISNGPDNKELNSNFKNRGNENYLHSLGKTVLELTKVVPDGLLIFFPSYGILNTCMTNWQTNGIWEQIQQSKPIFIEPRFKDEFNNTMKTYYEKINNETMQGAIFMAVCRGKVSEGLDFADTNGRAVIITGIPFPPLFDPKIRLKRNYMELNYRSGNESLSGDQWYALEASRAVNQAIGRVIRHKNDFGAILLCDCRFGSIKQKSQLSKWIQRHIKHDHSTRSFSTVISSISNFFRDHQSSSAEVDISRSVVLRPDEISPSQTNGNHQATTSNLIMTPDRTMSASTIEIQSISSPSTSSTNIPVSIEASTSSASSTPSSPTTFNQIVTIQDSPMLTIQDSPMLTIQASPMLTIQDSPMLTIQDSPMLTIQDSPMSACIRQISSLPLSSPSSDNITVSFSSPSPSMSSSVNISSNGTPNKQKCNINLSQRFNDEN